MQNASGVGVVTLADLALDDLRPDDSISMIGGSIGGGGSWLRRLCAGLDGITEAVGRGEAWCDEQAWGSDRSPSCTRWRRRSLATSSSSWPQCS